MTAPQLNLGVSAQGIDTLERLATALGAVYAASEKLKNQKPSAAGGGGLKVDGFDKVIAAIQAGSAQQATALAELANIVKDGMKGYGRAASKGFADATADVNAGAGKLNKAVKDRTRELEANFQALGDAGKRNSILRARAYMDEGFATADLTKKFSQSALAQAEAMEMGSGKVFLKNIETMKIRAAAATLAVKAAQKATADLNAAMAFGPDRNTRNAGEASQSIAQQQAADKVRRDAEAYQATVRPDRGTLNAGLASQSVAAQRAAEKALRDAEIEQSKMRPDRGTSEAQNKAAQDAMRKAVDLEAEFQALGAVGKRNSILRARAYMDEGREADKLGGKFSASAIAEASNMQPGSGKEFLRNIETMKTRAAAATLAAKAAQKATAELNAVMAFGPDRNTQNAGLARESVAAQRKAQEEMAAAQRRAAVDSLTNSEFIGPQKALYQADEEAKAEQRRATRAAAKAQREAQQEAQEAGAAQRRAAREARREQREADSADAAVRRAKRKADAANREADAVRRLDAAYEHLSAKGQLNKALNAKSFIDAGGSVPKATEIYGTKAVGADLVQLQAAAAGTNKLTMSMGALHSATRGAAQGFNALWMTWSQQLVPLLAGAAVSNAFVQVVKQGSQVNHTFEMMRVLGENTTGQMAELNKEMLSLAYNGPRGPQEIADAMRTLSLAGLDAGKVKVAIKDVLNFATVGDTDAKTAAETLVAVGTAYGYTASQFGRVGDIIAKSAAMSMASVEGMSASFKYSTVVAEQFGVSLEDMATVMISLSQRGIQGSSAGVAARQFYQELSGANNKVRAILKKNNIDIFETTGAVKPLLVIVEELSGKLDKMNPADARKLLSDLMNERGGKAGSSVLEDYVRGTSKVKDGLEAAGKSAEGAFKSLAELRKEVREGSAGFNALSNAALQMTAANQMKSVKAALQGSFVEAFQGVEPTILRISMTMRQTFASPEFQQAIQNIAISVGNLTLFLAQNLGTVTELAKGYLVLKSGMIGAGLIFNSVGKWGAAASAAGGGLATVGGFLTKLNPILAVATTVLTAGAAAWALFYRNATPPSTFDGFDGYIKTLQEEEKRLILRNTQLQKGLDLRSAELAVAGMLQRENALKVVKSVEVEKQTAYAAADKIEATANQRFGPGAGTPGPYADMGLKTAKRQAEAIRAAARAKYAEAVVNFDNLDTEQRRVEGAVRNLSVGDPTVKSPLGNANIPRLPDGTEAPGTGGGGATLDRGYRALEQSLDRQLSATDSYYTARKAIIDAAEKAREMTSAQAAAKLQSLTDAESAEKLQHIRDFERKAAEELKDIRARAKAPGKDGKPDLQAIAELEQAETRLLKVRQEQDTQTQINALNSKGWYNALGETSRTAVESANAWKLAEDGKYAAAARALTLSPKQLAAENARMEAASQFRTVIADLNKQLEENRSALDLANTEVQSYSSEQVAATEELEKRIKALTDQINKLKAAQGKLGDSAAAGASAGYRSPMDTKIAELGNWESYGEKAGEEFRSGFYSNSRDLFKQAMLKGKLDFSNLRKFVLDQFAGIAFDMFLGKPVDDFAKGLFGSVTGMGKDGKDSKGNQDQPSLSGLWDMAKNSKVGGAISSFFGGGDKAKNFMGPPEAESPGVLAGIWDTVKNSSVGKTVSGMFGGSAGNTNTADFMTSIEDAFKNFDFSGALSGLTGAFEGLDWGSMLSGMKEGIGQAMEFVKMLFSANGNAFNGSGLVTAFANGGSFSNSVVSSPTMFQYGGGRLGVMGEKGAEAVMPLERGPGGRLGVRASGGGQVIVQRTVNQYNTFAAGVSRSEMAYSLAMLREVATSDDIERQKRNPNGSK